MTHHLWKEWRDHRAVILGICALLPPVVFAAILLVPKGLFALPTAGAAAGLAIAALALGADLVPDEVRRGTISFLRRLPDGLGAVFAAKAALLVGTLALSAALGYTAASLAERAAGPSARSASGATAAWPSCPGSSSTAAACASPWCAHASTTPSPPRFSRPARPAWPSLAPRWSSASRSAVRWKCRWPCRPWLAAAVSGPRAW